MSWALLRRIAYRLTTPVLLLTAGGSLSHVSDYWLSNGTLSSLELLLGAAALATVITSLAPGLDRRWAALAAAVMGMSGATSLALSHERVPLPVVSWSSVLSLDPPARLYPAALLLLLTTAQGAVTADTRGRRVLRAAALLGCLGVGAYWLTPQYFYLEEVDTSRQGEMPVVIDGALERHPWRRDIFAGPPLLLLPQLIYVEWTRADLAHGLRWSMAQPGDSPDSPAPHSTLWRAQKLLSAGYYYLSAAAVIACAPLALLLLTGRPARSFGLAVTALLCGVTAAVPLANLGLLSALWGSQIAGLGDVALEELALLALFCSVALAALALARRDAPAVDGASRVAV